MAVRHDRLSLPIVIPIALALGVWIAGALLLHDSRTSRTEPKPLVRRGEARLLGPDINNAYRALVYIHAPTSTNSVIGLNRYQEVVAELVSRSNTGVRFYVIEEESADDTVAWVSGFRDARLQGLGHVGNGWVLWIEHGQLMDLEDTPGYPGKLVQEFVDRTRRLWP